MKNDIIRIKIEDIGINGEGIGKWKGFTFFVKDSIPGDFIEAKVMKENKSYGFAKLMNILEPSPSRVKPACEIADKCGGCQLQSLDYIKQLVYKKQGKEQFRKNRRPYLA